MRHLALGSVLLAVAGGLIWTHADTLGISAAWPILIGFALAPMTAGRTRLPRVTFGVATGIAAAWAAMAVLTYELPFIPLAQGLAVGVAIGVMGLLGATAPRTLSFPAMLIGFGTFFGYYQPAWEANRGAFLGDSAAAAATVLLAITGAMAVSQTIASMTRVEAEAEVVTLRRAEAPTVVLPRAAGGEEVSR